MRNRRTILIPFCLFMIVMLSACSSVVNKQIKAIDKLFAEEKNAHPDFLFRCDNLKEQIQAQSKGLDSRQTEITYNINVQLPDIEKIDMINIKVTAPQYDLNTADNNVYAQKYKESLKAAVIGYCKDKDNRIPAIDNTITVTLKKEGGWAAFASDEEIKTVIDQFDKSIQLKTDLMLKDDEDAAIVNIASHKQDLLRGIFGYQSYVDGIRLSSVRRAGDERFIIDITYPDPEQVYSSAFHAVFNTFNDKIYTKYTSNSLDANLLNSKIAEAIKGISDMKTASLTLSGENYATVLVPDIKPAIPDMLAKEQKSLAARINAKFYVKPLKHPVTGQKSGSRWGSKLVTSVPPGNGGYYLKFFKLKGSSLKSRSTLAMTAFIHQGKTTTLYLPAGNYKLKYAFGKKWYGSKTAFGPTGTYKVSDLLIKVKSGFYYNLKLYGVTNGNMSTREIRQNDF